jgi:hypothetical protein
MYMLMGFNVAFESCDVGSENRTCTAMHCTAHQNKAKQEQRHHYRSHTPDPPPTFALCHGLLTPTHNLSREKIRVSSSIPSIEQNTSCGEQETLYKHRNG